MIRMAAICAHLRATCLMNMYRRVVQRVMCELFVVTVMCLSCNSYQRCRKAAIFSDIVAKGLMN